MTKCSLSEMYKILCGILNYVQMHYIDWVSSFSPSCRVKLNAYAVGWVGIDGVKQLQLRPAVERPTAWSRWYHNIQSIRKRTERPIFNYIGGNIRLGRHAADGNNGEGCKPSFSFLLWCRFIEYKWLQKRSVVPVYPVDGLYFWMKLL